MTTITERVIRDDYPDRKATGQTFDDEVEIDDVDGFEMIRCRFTYDTSNGKVLKLEKCKNIRLTECKFPRKDASSHGDDSLDVVFLDNNCEDIRIKRCHFEGKENKGNFIDIKDGSKIRIEDCDFSNQTYTGENGGEAILIGRGENHGSRSFRTVVTGCTFTNCSGDPEVISIKQSESEISDNTFEDWERGNVSIRFGNRNTIKKNTFKGSGGGIVVRGERNEILENTHIGNNNQSHDYDFRPITLECGNDEGYAKAKDSTIDNNTFENCRGPCIVLGQERRDRKPSGNKFRNNILKADDVDSTFLIVPDHIGNNTEKKRVRDANTYRDNELRGRHTRPGILEGVSGAFK